MGRIVFVIGGARSGKSKFALKEASGIPGRKLYIATAEPFDEEMIERIQRHKRERSADWEVIEEPVDITGAIKRADPYDVLLLDCLTLWISNIKMRYQERERQEDTFNGFVKALKEFKDSSDTDATLFIVSNEVGMGIVPTNELTRDFRDSSGFLNQRVAEMAEEVYFVIAGIPLRIKGGFNDSGDH